MLAQVLPGVRELRGPLASGYLWLLAIWLIASPDIPARSEATGVVADLYRLSDAVSAVGVAVALSFAAYLLGALTEGVLDAIVQRSLMVRLGGSRGQEAIETLVVAHVADRARKHLQALAALESGFTEATRPASESGLISTRGELEERRRALRHELAELQADATTLLFQVAREAKLLPTRLQLKQPELFQTYDRMRAEAEVRFGVVLPLLVLFGALAMRESGWWAAGWVLVALIGVQGMRARVQASRLLADAALLGEIVLPPIEREQRAIESFIAQVQLPAAWVPDSASETSKRLSGQYLS